MKNKQFTCPVSMAVTEEQFNSDLRQPLIELGYNLNGLIYFNRILVNNSEGVLGHIYSHSYQGCEKEKNRHFIDHYNPKLFLALASLTTDSTETKEEVLARFEKGVERELIGYRFKNDEYNRMTIKYFSGFHRYELRANNTHASEDSDAIILLKKLNLLDTFCEPVYKEIETISISEAEKELKGFGREVKIDKDLK